MAQTQTQAPQGRVARRRARVHERILEVAEALITEHGVDGVTIEAITDAADIARRSFYHHFAGKNEVLVPIARARTRRLNRRIDGFIADIADPADVMATALRLALRAISDDPLCAWFLMHSGLGFERLYEGFAESGMRDIQRAVEAGRFRIANPEVVRALVSGAFIAVLSARADGKLDDTDLDDAVEHLLRLFGVDAGQARHIAHRNIQPLPADTGGPTDVQPTQGVL